MSITTGVVWADAHAPEHDIKAVRCVRKAIELLKPTIMIDLGDAGDFESINYFLHSGGQKLQLENKRLLKDLDAMYQISEYIVAPAKYSFDRPGGIELIKLLGTHEHWVERYVDNHPELEGIPSLDITTIYEDLGWNVIPWGKFYAKGKLLFHHGDRKGYQSKHHASQWAAMGKSVVYAHFHSVQRFTHETIKRNGVPDKHGAFAIGCLRKLDPLWMENRRNTWQQSFGVFYMAKNGFFNFYNVDITKGKCILNGVEIDGNKE